MRIISARRLVLGSMLAVMSLTTASAWAHHSGSMFEPKKVLSVDGTVKQFQWTNPHSWLQVVVTDSKGAQQEWSLELGPSVGLWRSGWRPHVLNPGDKVAVTLHPLRDGEFGGRLVKVTLPDGRVFYGEGGPPQG